MTLTEYEAKLTALRWEFEESIGGSPDLVNENVRLRNEIQEHREDYNKLLQHMKDAENRFDKDRTQLRKWIKDAVDNMGWMHETLAREELGLQPGDDLHIQGQQKLKEKLRQQFDGLQKKDNLLEWAWTIIANGDWSASNKEWQSVAEKWRDSYFAQMTPHQKGEYVHPESAIPPQPPQFIGSTLVNETPGTPVNHL